MMILYALSIVAAVLAAAWLYHRRIISRETATLFRPSRSSPENPISMSLGCRGIGEPLELVHAGQRIPLVAPGHAGRPDWAEAMEAAGFKQDRSAQVWTRANGKRELRILRGGKWKRLERLASLLEQQEAAS